MPSTRLVSRSCPLLSRRTNNTAFTLPYLELCYLGLMRCKSSPGQEIAVRQIYHEKDSMQLRSESMFRAFLLRGLEAYITLKRNQGIVPEFNYDQPSKYSEKIGSDGSMLFKVPEQVKVISFDGHFGVHRKLVDKVDGPRTVRVSGHPKKLREHERAASCARKDSLRYALPQRTAGWQFALDPESRKVLGAKEHISNESHADKAKLLRTTSNVKPDVLIHDDMCHFEKFVKKRTPKDFMGIRYWLVDLFHCKNHLCNKKEWRPCEHKRCKHIRTNMSESFNAWIRPLNFFLNSLNAHSHKFWVREACLFYNAHLPAISDLYTRRSNAVSRSTIRRKSRGVLKRPSVQKRPAAMKALVRKQPASGR